MNLIECYFLTIISLISLIGIAKTTGDYGHAKMLKDFVSDQPHLHDLVDRMHEGDVSAKDEFEKRSLAARFNNIKKKLLTHTDEVHIVIHFLEDYSRNTEDNIATDSSFMTLKPFMNMLEREEDLRNQLLDLGKKLENEECDFSCLGDNLSNFMNEAIVRITSHIEL